ncbi:hypothetical protein LBMAG56_11030 [Verrucomicrobiota bacterium]|nr:hypothetical protein LBMAG56_11030 [Verrucomicrobiota bacterium]
MCKVSGMVTEAHWENWHAPDFRPYLVGRFVVVGPERLMIGSDWPVSLLAATYEESFGLVSDYLAQFPAALRDQVLGGNAAKFYGVKP